MGSVGQAVPNTLSTSASFSGLPVSENPFRDGEWLVAGNGHTAYQSYRHDLGSYTVDSTDYGKGIVAMVDPNEIEGISISEYDYQNPEVFWSQHKQGGTMESFVEIATHIPEVQSRLNSGIPLDDLLNDPILGSCAGIYFSPNSPTAPTVLKGNGFYEFESNGRHRIMAARILGHRIPIRIVGEIVRK